MNVQIIPSILSADFGNLQEEVDKVKGADLIQVDVMDGHFVPNISIGPGVQKAIKTGLPIETHLMVTDPMQYIQPFADAGSKRLIVHIESMGDPQQVFDEIRKRGMDIGLALNPDTPLERIKPYLEQVDVVLCMTVNPGFGSQAFIDSVLPKIKELRGIFDKDIEVDGGINFDTGKRCVDAGANLLVIGSFLYKNPDLSPEEVIARFKESS